MNKIERILRVVDYIEENISAEMDWVKASAAGFYSPFHLHRIFSSLTGETLGAYLRKRKLTIAAMRLSETDDSIARIAETAGFASQASFTRAFKAQFHFPPAEYRELPCGGLQFGRFPITIDELQKVLGGHRMEPIIKEMDEMILVGMEKITVPNDHKIPELWQSFFGRMREIQGAVNPKMCFGFAFSDWENMDVNAMMNDFSEKSPFITFVCMQVENSQKIPKGMVARQIPPMKYAVFTHKGPMDKLQETYAEIYGKWVVSSGYEIADGFDFELYDERFKPEDPLKSEFDICLPIK